MKLCLFIFEKLFGTSKLSRIATNCENMCKNKKFKYFYINSKYLKITSVKCHLELTRHTKISLILTYAIPCQACEIRNDSKFSSTDEFIQG